MDSTNIGNYVSTTLTAPVTGPMLGPTAPSSDIISVESSTGFPDVPFVVLLSGSDGSNPELVLVVDQDGLDWTVYRAQEDTESLPHDTGDVVGLVLSVGALEGFVNQAIGGYGLSGEITGTPSSTVLSYFCGLPVPFLSPGGYYSIRANNTAESLEFYNTGILYNPSSGSSASNSFVFGRSNSDPIWPSSLVHGSYPSPTNTSCATLYGEISSGSGPTEIFFSDGGLGAVFPDDTASSIDIDVLLTSTDMAPEDVKTARFKFECIIRKLLESDVVIVSSSVTAFDPEATGWLASISTTGNRMQVLVDLSSSELSLNVRAAARVSATVLTFVEGVP